MANRTDTQNQLAELFKRKKCYTIEQLSQRLNYSLISIRRFLKVIGYYTSFTHNSKWYMLRFRFSDSTRYKLVDSVKRCQKLRMQTAAP